MSSNIRIKKFCRHCGQEFIARTTVTKYCSETCAKRAYKVKIRNEKIQKSNAEVTCEKIEESAILNQNSYFEIKTFDYLTVAEAATLLKCDRRTIYRLIDTGRIPSANLSIRRIRILKKDIDALFAISEKSDLPVNAPNINFEKIQLKDCYSITEIIGKYNISDSSLRTLCKKNKIPKFQKGKFVYVPKSIIDPILKNYLNA